MLNDKINEIVIALYLIMLLIKYNNSMKTIFCYCDGMLLLAGIFAQLTITVNFLPNGANQKITKFCTSTSTTSVTSYRKT